MISTGSPELGWCIESASVPCPNAASQFLSFGSFLQHASPCLVALRCVSIHAYTYQRWIFALSKEKFHIEVFIIFFNIPTSLFEQCQQCKLQLPWNYTEALIFLESMDFSTQPQKYNLWRYIIISLFIIQSILAVSCVVFLVY